jgi:two-component sensor histidine kinase
LLSCISAVFDPPPARRAKREKRWEQSMSRQQRVNVEFDPQVGFFHQAVLLHELNHRINNEYASAIGAVSLAAAQSGNEEVKTGPECRQ